MATRMDKHYRIEQLRKRRIARFINFIKFNIILIMFVIMTYSLFIVNNTIIELNCLDNPKLLSIDSSNNEITILGKPYYINLEVLNKFN